MHTSTDLHNEIVAGHTADRDLAEHMGMRLPAQQTLPPGADARALDADEAHVVRRAQAGDAQARARLVDAYMPLIRAHARRYRGQADTQELIQEGVVGLLRALARYDASRDADLGAYASWWIRQAMQQLVAELSRPVVMSDRQLRALARVRRAEHADPHATHAQLAHAASISQSDLRDLQAADRAPHSWDAPVGDGAQGVFGDLLADPVGDSAYTEVLDALEGAHLRQLVGGLSDRERAVVRARYGLDGDEPRSLRSVGDALGMSAERVRQIEARALDKLRVLWAPTPGDT